MAQNDSHMLVLKNKGSSDLLIDRFYDFYFLSPMLVFKKKIGKGRFDLLINQLYDCYFLYPKGQYVIYLVTFILGILYAIINNLILGRPEERIVYESLLLASVLVIGFTIMRAIIDISSQAVRNISPDVFRVLEDNELRAKMRAKESSPLTSREQLLLTLYLEGYTSKEIADKLNDDVRLVRFDLNAVRAKITRLIKSRARAERA